MSAPLLGEYFSSDFIWVTVYRALVAVLRNDTVLSRLVVSWDVREGDQNETQPPGEGGMPWVAVVPLDGDMQPVTEDEDEHRFRCRIDLAVRGTNWNDLANCAGAVRSALAHNARSPDATLSVMQYFMAAGANNFWLRRAGIGVRRTESPPADTGTAGTPPVVDQFASAVIEFQLFLPTVSADYPGLP